MMETPITQTMYLCGRYGDTYRHHLVNLSLIEK